MIIRRVKLQNILSHENSEVEFTEGVVSIVGPNGAGKSSIIDSIYVALFTDTKPDIRGGKKEFLVTRGRESGKISVVFEVGGRQYIVERELNVRGAAQAYLYEIRGDRKKLSSYGVSNVVEEVRRLLGLSTYDTSEVRKVIRATIFSAQDELTKIIDISDSERKEWILSLLGLSHLEKALENMRRVLREETSRLEGEYGSLKKILDKDRDDLVNLEKDISQLIELAKSLRERRNTVSEKLGHLEEKMRLVDEAVDISILLRNSLAAQLIRELEDRVRSLEVLKSWDTSSYVKLVGDLPRKKEELEKAEKELMEILRELEVATGTSSSDFEKSYEEIERRVSVLSRREGEVRERARLLREILSRFELSDKCPICGSTITNPEAVRRRLSGEISDIERELGGLVSELDSLLKKKRFLADMLKQVLSLKSKIEVVRGEVGSLERELSELESRALELCHLVGVGSRLVDECFESLRRLKVDLEEGLARLKLLKSQLQFEATVAEADRVEKLRSRLATILGELGVTAPSYFTLEVVDRLASADLRNLRKEIEKNLNELRRELIDLESRISGIEGSIDSKRRVADELRRRILESEASLKELERKIRAYELLDSFSGIYLGKSGEIAKNLTKAVRAGLERKANRILSRLKLPPIRINDEFQIFVQLPGGEVPIRNASGGERVGISLALRLALAEIVMGRTPTALIVDEPTVYLDSERREQLFNVIRELGRSLRQLIVVTHDDVVTGISDRVILVESVGGVSRTS
ncbi:MAG: SMC family ATPase [Sulfolobales archaeon]|nr:SMC family ATPase [Sulfolobales archaeon]MCX8209142.1 SMC family ATPase [Sulfolobales archaeon]MDW8010308.1 SMC family ATPase [Sulfolobales archaeon]